MRRLVSARLRPIRLSRFLLTEQEPQIALGALTRLRWLAVVGQIAATVVALVVLKLQLPIVPIAVVAVLTAASNAAAVMAMRRRRPLHGLVQGLVLLDVGSLTTLLYFTGGGFQSFLGVLPLAGGGGGEGGGLG